jgi:hypothetical protein
MEHKWHKGQKDLEVQKWIKGKEKQISRQGQDIFFFTNTPR